MIKKLLLTLGLAGIAAGAFAQATINFDNVAIPSSPNFFNPPLVQDSPNPDGSGAASVTNSAGAYTVALYWSSNSVAGGPGQGVGSVGLFFVGSYHTVSGLPAGKFNGGAFTVNGLAGSSTGFFEVVGWMGNAADYATAMAGVNPHIGATVIFSAPTGTAGSTSAVPGELTGWSANLVLHPVPEPTTIALGGLGVAALLLFRRRK